MSSTYFHPGNKWYFKIWAYELKAPSQEIILKSNLLSIDKVIGYAI